MTEDATVKEDLEYRIGEIQLVNQASYNAAYKTLMGVSGERKGDALMLAGASSCTKCKQLWSKNG